MLADLSEAFIVICLIWSIVSIYPVSYLSYLSDLWYLSIPSYLCYNYLFIWYSIYQYLSIYLSNLVVSIYLFIYLGLSIYQIYLGG